MGQTNRNYRVWEAALSLEDAAPHTNGTKERRLSGDIIALRRPSIGIGTKEAHTFLWIRLEGLEENDMARLTDPATDTGDETGNQFDKRRYAIPLERLKKAYPSFDIAKSLDAQTIYQPFLTLDRDTFQFLTTTPPLHVEGLVFDKATGRYL